MKLSELDDVLCSITEEEMKKFQTENIWFSHVVQFLSFDDIHANVFVFHTKNSFVIEFRVSIFRNNDSQMLNFLIEMCAVEKKVLRTGFNPKVLNKYKHDIQPIVSFLDKKTKEIEVKLKNHKKIRLLELVGNQTLCVKNMSRELYDTLENE